MTPTKSALPAILRGVLVTLVLGGLTGAALLGNKLEPIAARMTQAAQQFVQSLTPEQRRQACFSFDDAQRYAWHFVPLQDQQKQPTRKGLRLEQMSDPQKQAALDLIRSGLSDDGFAKIKTIFSLEEVLREQENGRGPMRNPGWYFVSFYGEPDRQGAWGWRVDGHHVALNFTLSGGQVTSATPAFFGSNPGEVKAGPRQGTRPLAQRYDLVAALVQSLSESQNAKARQEKAFGEVQGQTKSAKVGAPVGLPAADLQPNQKKALRTILENYLSAFAADLAAQERNRIEAAGWDRLVFAYSGSFAAGQPVTYRIQGPELLVEFLNVQADGAGNKNNHYHSSLRTLPTDFTP
jgi:hypothetical protein